MHTYPHRRTTGSQFNSNKEEHIGVLKAACQRLSFYFSGHGLKQPDSNEDEIDGFDETLCPADFMNEEMITDDDINSTIVRPLKEGVSRKWDWKDNKAPAIRKHTSGGLAICMSVLL